MVIKKANNLKSFKIGSINFLEIMKFLGGATFLDSFFKAFETIETKGFSLLSGLTVWQCWQARDWWITSIWSLFERNQNPLEKDLQDYQKSRSNWLDERQALKKLQFKTKSASEWDNYKIIEEIWQKLRMATNKVFFALFNNKVVVPTLEAMQNMVQFYHQKENDMLKLGCTLPNLVNICLNISTKE